MLKLFITLALFASVALSQQGSILETAETAQQFNTLIAAVNAAGLTDTLNGPGPFTVFAPTDAAFAALGQDTIDELLMPENREQLTNIVLYHVVSGEVDSAALESAGNANALNGGELTFTAPAPGSLQVNGVSIIGANVQASNGIIHVIDAVLMPSEDGGNGGMTPGGEPGTEMTGEASGNADSGNDDDDDDDSSSSDDDDSSSDDDDSTTMSAAAPSGEEAGETFDEVIDAAEAVVDAKVDMVTGQMTREEIKALKDSLAEEVEALEARCEAAMSGSSDDDDDDSSSSDDDDSSSSSVTDARECRHQVNAILREGRSDIGSEYWSARSSSSSDDDDDSSSSDDDDDSSSS